MAITRKKGPWVLIVADEPELTAQVRGVVEAEGLAAVAAGGAAEALAAAAGTTAPCMALVDALLPGAAELALELTAREQCLVATIPVRLSRRDGVLVKQPVRLDIITEALREHCLDRRTARRG